MIVIGWKAIWLSNSVQFGENAAKHQTVTKQQNKPKKNKYIKNKHTTIKQTISFQTTQYAFRNVLLS